MGVLHCPPYSPGVPPLGCPAYCPLGPCSPMDCCEVLLAVREAAGVPQRAETLLGVVPAEATQKKGPNNAE